MYENTLHNMYYHRFWYLRHDLCIKHVHIYVGIRFMTLLLLLIIYHHRLMYDIIFKFTYTYLELLIICNIINSAR